VPPDPIGEACLGCRGRIDLLIEEAVVVELKATDKLQPINEAQLLTYLKLSGNRVGLLLNFNTIHLRDGIKRRVL
jgi:GxxExxY protein